MAEKRYRVAVIGRTGRGNYGHAIDVAWKTHPRADIVAVADDNPGGLKQAQERLGVRAGYAEYTKMIREERPEIVVVAPRWVDCHLDMTLAAIEHRASVFMEKPMAQTPEQCDRMIGAADTAHVKISVAHNMRVCPILDYVERRIAEGLIGQVQEIRSRGKEDRRAGGEDMMVLGSHCFDLLRRFAGDPLWALGRVTVNGRPLRREDVIREGPEGLGPIAGDSIDGVFGFAGGLTGYFASRKNPDISGRRFGIQIFGSKGVLAILAGHVPPVFYADSPTWTEAPWQPLEMPAGIRPVSERDAYHLMIDDLLDAIEQDRDPISSGRNTRWTIEMAMAIYASERAGGRVPFPLARRTHALEN